MRGENNRPIQPLNGRLVQHNDLNNPGSCVDPMTATPLYPPNPDDLMKAWVTKGYEEDVFKKACHEDCVSVLGDKERERCSWSNNISVIASSSRMICWSSWHLLQARRRASFSRRPVPHHRVCLLDRRYGASTDHAMVRDGRRENDAVL